MSKDELNIVLLVLVLVAILIASTIVYLFSVFNNRKNKLIQEQLETKLNNQKRQHELELNALRAQMNPHFVHNSLNAIQYYIQLNEVEKSEDYLSKFSKLMRQFFEYSRKERISVAHEISLLKNYLDIEKLRFEDDFDFQLNIDKALDTQDLFLPPMILQPIVENAINHGIFHKKGKGEVSIDFVSINDYSFKVEITDDGIGINKSKLMNAKKKQTHTEHSSFVLEERLTLLKDSKHWDVAFTIQDRADTSDKTGTKVTLIFKEGLNEDDYDH
ncbi:sensor histidine kinase [Olleya sp. 1-3]|uniref:sensor histidine kinase n=1 Tax=Olleya sp. 1-3 TaxID=2058323 RepID=UPI000C31BA06|nr:histidine kinase [Olleya sp. 1-3]PKG53407.1 histidine kinase transcriptional regulator protein [Olleya sp. 1-3]